LPLIEHGPLSVYDLTVRVNAVYVPPLANVVSFAKTFVLLTVDVLPVQLSVLK